MKKSNITHIEDNFGITSQFAIDFGKFLSSLTTRSEEIKKLCISKTIKNTDLNILEDEYIQLELIHLGFSTVQGRQDMIDYLNSIDNKYLDSELRSKIISGMV